MPPLIRRYIKTRSRERIVILGAAGRDFHDFNVVYRDDPSVTVVAFTATQIPGIAGRRYPPSLAGLHYPARIPIAQETELETICRREGVTRSSRSIRTSDPSCPPSATALSSSTRSAPPWTA